MDLSHILNSKKIKLSFFLAVLSVLFVAKAFAIQENTALENAGGKKEAFDPTVAILSDSAPNYFIYRQGFRNVFFCPF